MKKLFFISIIVIIVLLVLSFLIVNLLRTDFDQEWTYCSVDSDCILVDNYSPCACSDFAINSKFEDKYSSFLRQEMRSSLRRGFMCKPCNYRIPNPVVTCDIELEQPVCVVV